MSDLVGTPKTGFLASRLILSLLLVNLSSFGSLSCPGVLLNNFNFGSKQPKSPNPVFLHMFQSISKKSVS